MSFFVTWALLGIASSAPTSSSVPTVAIKNGTVAGMHSSTYNEDFFLGVPYAQPPIDELRFRIPQSINTSFTGIMTCSRALLVKLALTPA